jgi:hypothetical protein
MQVQVTSRMLHAPYFPILNTSKTKTQCLIHHNAMFVRVPYLRVLLHEAFRSARRHILWQSCDF